MQPVVHHLNGVKVVRAVNVHFVDVRYTGNSVFACLMPDRFALGFYAALRAEGCDSAVQNAERTFNFDRKVNVSGGIYNVYAVSLPMAGGRRAGNGDTAFLLLNHPVHGSFALVSFA